MAPTSALPVRSGRTKVWLNSYGAGVLARPIAKKTLLIVIPRAARNLPFLPIGRSTIAITHVDQVNDRQIERLCDIISCRLLAP